MKGLRQAIACLVGVERVRWSMWSRRRTRAKVLPGLDLTSAAALPLVTLTGAQLADAVHRGRG
jgi:hypothetical protein